MDQILPSLASIMYQCKALLNDPHAPLTDGEPQAFTRIIHDKAQSLHRQLVPIINALQTRQPGDSFPGDMHDLRTPLVSIIGYSDILVEGMAGELTEKQRETFIEINTCGTDVRLAMEKLYEMVDAELHET